MLQAIAQKPNIDSALQEYTLELAFIVYSIILYRTNVLTLIAYSFIL